MKQTWHCYLHWRVLSSCLLLWRGDISPASPASLSCSALWQQCPSSPLLVWRIAGGGKEHRQEKAAGFQHAGAGSHSALCTGFFFALTCAGPSAHPYNSQPLHSFLSRFALPGSAPSSFSLPLPCSGALSTSVFHSKPWPNLTSGAPGTVSWAFTALPAASLCQR